MSRSLLSRNASDLARAAFFENLYRGRNVLAVGLGDGAVCEVLLARGAARVVGVDADPQAVEMARRRLGARGELKLGGPLLSAEGPFDVVLLSSSISLRAAAEWFSGERDPVALLRERLGPSGWLVVATPGGDGGEAEGARFHELRDRLAGHFAAVTMFGQSALAGSVIAPFAERDDEEAEPVLDTALAPPVVPELYVAVAGPRRVAAPYGLIALPPASMVETHVADLSARLERALSEVQAARRRADAERREAQVLREALAEAERRLQAHAEDRALIGRLRAAVGERDERLGRLDEERRLLAGELERRASDQQASGQQVTVLQERLSQAERAADELRVQLARSDHGLAHAHEAARRHAEEMRRLEAVLSERDAYIAEMEQDQRAIEQLRVETQEALARAETAEARERAARRRIAELEGTVIRLQHGGVTTSGSESRQVSELKAQVAELEAHAGKLKQKMEEAQREAWTHMRARSEAEAAAAELREDNVRKLKDARKVANVELMRATEEALKKGVTLKEELARAEKERKETLAQLQAAREGFERERAAFQAQAEAMAAQLASVERERERLRLERDEGLAREPAEMPLEAAREELGRLDDALQREAERIGELEEALRRAEEQVRRDIDMESEPVRGGDQDDPGERW